MAFSTQAQLTSNVTIIEKTIDAADLTTWTAERIAFADRIVRQDLSNCIDFDNVGAITADPPTPDFINLLSQYKAAEMSYVRLGSVKRRFNEQDDREFWTNQYDALLESIKMGAIVLEDEDGNSVGTGVTGFSKPSKTAEDVPPEFGYGNYGQSTNDETLKKLRDNDRAREDYR